MQYFIDTVETIIEGVGFTHFGPVHLVWIAIFIISGLVKKSV